MLITSSSTKLLKKGGAALAALLLSACVPQAGYEQAQIEANKKILEEAAPGSKIATYQEPDVRFLIKDDLYAVPIAVDASGCEQFTTWSESGTQSLAQAIYFHDGQGSFSPIKSYEASCNATMVETGSDSTGCRTFRAKQPEGPSSEVIYYRSRNGYTVKRERSVCG